MFIDPYIELLSREYEPRFVKQKPKELEYMRKKCKSCIEFSNRYKMSYCIGKANSQACKHYIKRKK